MFRTHSPYSPFFTSGLLSSFDRPRSPDVPLSPRRGSLPTDTASSPSADESAAFYFTLQPRRDEDEFRSFLSLDLAESQSMRSASLKRKASSSTRSRSTKAASAHPFRFPRIPEVPPPAPAAASAGPLRMRFSRDSLRTIPSPKPAPSITLPELPKLSTASIDLSLSLPTTPSLPTLPVSAPLPSASASPAPRLPSFQPIPALELNLPSLRFSALIRPPTLTRLASLKGKAAALAAPYPAPSSSQPLPPQQQQQRPDLRVTTARLSVATTSTVSTRVRRTNRSDALARLEGRHAPLLEVPHTAPLARPRRALPVPPTMHSAGPAKATFGFAQRASQEKRNFMSMSDDEDESGAEDEVCPESCHSRINSSSSSSSSSSGSSTTSSASSHSNSNSMSHSYLTNSYMSNTNSFLSNPNTNTNSFLSNSFQTASDPTRPSSLASLDIPGLRSLHTQSLNPFAEPEDMVLPPPPSMQSHSSWLPLPSPGFLDAPRSAPLPPPQYSPASTRSGFLDVHKHEDRQRSSTLQLPSLRRKRTRNRAEAHAQPQWHSFIDLQEAVVYGEGTQKHGRRAKKARSGETGGEARDQDKDKENASGKEERKSKESKGSGKEKERRNTDSWTWRSFIEVAHAA